MSLSNNFPTVSPTLNLNFAAAGRLDSRVTFTRSSTATYTNQIGLIQSAAVNEPRFDYDPVTLAARGLLVEESRTNLLTYSEQVDNAAWTKTSLSVTANSLSAPDGTVTADKFIETAANNLHRVISSSFAAGTYTISVYAKAGERTKVELVTAPVDARFDLSTGTVISGTGASIVSVGNGWYRCVLTFTQAISSSVGYGLLDASGNATYTGDGTSGAYFWGAQLEQGSFSTSYIPTVAASVTRSADVASVNTLSPWWNASAGTFFIENTFGSYGNQPIALSDQAAVGNAWIYGDAGVIKSYIAGPNISISSGVSVAANTYAKSAFAFGADGKAISVNGSTPVVSANTTAPTASTQLSLGNWPGGQYDINGHIKRVAYYPVRLSNAQLQALTL